MIVKRICQALELSFLTGSIRPVVSREMSSFVVFTTAPCIVFHVYF